MNTRYKVKLFFKIVRKSNYRFFNALFYNIIPSYRIAAKNQKILTHIYLMLQDLRRENMPLESGERLASVIHSDHLKRYEFAHTFLKDGNKVLDIACGVGYGSHLMGDNKKVNITGVDISTKAIAYANEHFKRDNIKFICSRAEQYEPKNLFDVIISFETIEHLENARSFIESITKHLKKGGLFICSTPNELLIPHFILDAPFHYRHYTPRQMSKLLTKRGGLKIEAIYAQNERNDFELTAGKFGSYTVHVGRKI